MQIKTTTETTLMPTKWLKFKSLTILSVNKDMKWRFHFISEISYSVGKKVIWYNHFGKLAVSHKARLHSPYRSVISPLNKLKTNSHKKNCSQMFTRVSFIIFFLPCVIGRIMTFHLLIFKTCEYVISYGKMNFSDANKLRILYEEIILDDLDGPNIIIRVLIKGKKGRLVRMRRCEVDVLVLKM